MTAAPTLTSTPTRAPAAWPGRLARGVQALFPAPGAPPTRTAVAWGVLGAVAAAGVALARTGGPGALNTVWIEDSHFFLSLAWARPFWENVSEPMNGYFHTAPRIFAEIASVVPVRWAAPVLALEAVAMLAAFAAVAYVASGPFLSRWWLRLLVAAPVVAVPVGHTQVDNDVATLQFFGLYAMFWLLLWRPRTRAGQVAAVLLALSIAASSILPIVFVPLAVLRVVFTRDWTSRLIVGAYGAGMLLQLGGLATGATIRAFGRPNYNPLFVLREYVTRALPRALLGEQWMGGPGIDPHGDLPVLFANSHVTRVVLIGVALLLLAVAVVVALRFTRPHWPLAAAAGLSSLGVFAEEVANMGRTHPRYVVPAALLLYAAVVALLRPAPEPGPSWVPAAAFGLLLAVVCVVNLRTTDSRAESQPWDVTVRNATVACADANLVTYQYQYTWWSVFIPCERVR